ncbi:MAG: sporulation peptidase YabG [Firmicutes bacterium]|nr:sporulation peptidase YabG [Bacillota bacterium]
MFEVGDFVTRRSYKSDVVFRIERIEGNRAILRSYRIRLMADAELSDLLKMNQRDSRALKKELLLESYDCLQRQQRYLVLNGKQGRNNKDSFQEYPVKVLHIDGDREYLDLSIANYNNLDISVKGLFIPEKGQPAKIGGLVKEIKPDILVLTGHDGEVNNRLYHTSDFFVEAVKYARDIISDLDSLVIFAGACQSDYDRLIDIGANYASSPGNKLIHFLDPILVVEKVVSTSIGEIIPVQDVISNTVSGKGGIGGIETRGKMRMRYP